LLLLLFLILVMSVVGAWRGPVRRHANEEERQQREQARHDGGEEMVSPYRIDPETG
jgi:hypothetical protein